MKTLLKLGTLVALIALVFVMYRAKFHGTQRPALSSDVLLVGTNAEFAPFCFVENGEIVGFDIDVVKDVAQRLKKKIVFKDMPFESLLPEIQMGTIQLLAAGMTPTPERAQRILFTHTYLSGEPLMIVCRKSGPVLTKVEDLTDKNVVVNDGFNADLYMSAIKGPHLTRLPTTAEAMLALKNGNVDAYVSAFNAVKPFFDHYGSDEFIVSKIPGTSESVALGISKKYESLVEPINNAIDEMIKDGTIDALKKKWGIS